MFNSLNLSNSLLSEVSKILEASRTQYSIPVELQESAKKIAKTIGNVSLETKRSVIRDEFDQITEKYNFSCDVQTLNEYERCVMDNVGR